MAFAKACVLAPRPIAFVVDKFFEGSGKLNDYPDPTRYSFANTFVRSLGLFEVTRRQKRLGGTKDLLFAFDMPLDIGDAPEILGYGDVVLGFIHAPPYAHDDRDIDGSLAVVRGIPPLDATADTLEARFRDAALARWRALAPDGASEPPLSKASIMTSAVGRSRWTASPHNIKLRAGGTAKTYIAWRIGLVDVAFAAFEAVFETWRKDDQRTKAIEALARFDFGPNGVAKLSNEQYQETVGRGLAYQLLHEFWHATEETAGHSLTGFRVIEQDGGMRPVPDVRLQPATVKAVEKRYEIGWCKHVTDKRRGLNQL